ncbi:MAG: phage terminase small subunit P27 family [Candidatus Obscuribacterales bacterium]|nr:phage terminase small subunit P27 family [Candidatus Obscuribacterales bacterium]
MAKNRNQLKALSGGLLEPPFDLNGEALNQWHICAPELHRLGLLTDERKPILAEYCRTVAAAIEADLILNKDGIIISAKNGNPKAHPQLAISQKAWNRALSLGQKIGIGPLSRQRLTVKDAVTRKRRKKLIFR